MASLAEIRAKLMAQDNKFSTDNKRSNGMDPSLYPHWDIPNDSSVVLRFLPDADTKNDYFWRERQMMNIEFGGVKGDPSARPFVVKVPCIEMWEENACPIHAELRAWYKKKDDELSKLASKYWKKKSYIMQGFVRNSPITEESEPENPIRRFLVSPQIHNIIRAGLLDPEIENLPTDYNAGLNFTVNKTTKGQYADYATSSYSRRESSLSDSEFSAIDKYGLFTLNDFLPKRPTEVEIQAAHELFEASVDGQLFDPDRWGQYFYYPGKESGNSNNAGNSSQAPHDDDYAPFETTRAQEPVREVVREVVEERAETVEAPSQSESAAANGSSAKRAEDILAMIRNRSK